MRIQVTLLTLAASAILVAVPVQNRPPAVTGALPGGPVFAPDRPKPLVGNVLDMPNVFLEGDLVFYDHIGGHTTTAEESAKYLELARKYFKVKPAI